MSNLVYIITAGAVACIGWGVMFGFCKPDWTRAEEILVGVFAPIAVGIFWPYAAAFAAVWIMALAIRVLYFRKEWRKARAEDRQILESLRETLRGLDARVFGPCVSGRLGFAFATTEQGGRRGRRVKYIDVAVTQPQPGWVEEAVKAGHPFGLIHVRLHVSALPEGTPVERVVLDPLAWMSFMRE